MTMPPRRERPLAPTWAPDESSWRVTGIATTTPSTVLITIQSTDGQDRQYLFREEAVTIGEQTIFNVESLEFSRDTSYDAEAAGEVAKLVGHFFQTTRTQVHLGTPRSAQDTA